jgi:L,D-peptidoglycan transpeptidase YkuD (ErfK/YbiS/YcfS/YnhG family)
MKNLLKILVFFLIVIGIIFFLSKFKNERSLVKANPTSQSTQMILVRAHDWNSIMGALQLYERATVNDPWMKVGDRVGVSLSKNGLGWGIGLHGAALMDGPTVIEGSKRSPVGVFALQTAFGRDARPDVKLSYQPITDTTFCPDDPKSKYYNRIVDSKKVIQDWGSAEDMYRYMIDGVYAYGVVIEHNYKSPRAGLGSCFFLHVYRAFGMPTVGGTAVSLDQIEKIITWLDPDKNPILVQLPDVVFARIQQQWNLPE